MVGVTCASLVVGSGSEFTTTSATCAKRSQCGGLLNFTPLQCEDTLMPVEEGGEAVVELISRGC